MKLCFSVLFMIFFWRNVSANFSCFGFENFERLNNTPPQLIKFPYKSTHGDDKGDEVVLNTTKIIPISLDCWAAYPIDFTFSGHLTNQRVEVRTNVNKFSTSDGTTGHCYRIKVRLDTYKEITGNYSCFNIHNPMLISSKYVLVYSPPPRILLRNGETISVFADPGQNKTVILPCAISNPTFASQMNLLRKSGSNWERLLESPRLKYDPKIGYEMTIVNPFEKILGNYECRNGAVDVVRVNLVNLPEWVVYPKTRRIDLKVGDRLVIECFSKNEELVMKSSPELTSADLERYIGEILHSKGVMSSYKYREIIHTAPFTEGMVVGSVQCIRKRDGGLLHQWQYTVSNETRQEGVLDTRNLVNLCPNSINPHNQSELSIVLFECDNWVACKMSQCLRNDATCKPNNHCVRKLCMPNGIIQCPTANGVIAEIFFTGFNGIKYTNWKMADTKDILRIMVHNSTRAKGKYMNFLCEGTNFVVAGGFQWTINFSDGTTKALESDEEVMLKETWGETKSIIASTLTIPMRWNYFSGESKMESLSCFAPIWNSTEWISQSVRMDDTIIPFIQKEMKEKNAGNRSLSQFSCQASVLLYTLAFVFSVNNL